MEKYQHLMDLLKRTGHFVYDKKDLPNDDYKGVDFTPERIIGLMAHSLLSGRPRSNFYTDGKKIYYAFGKPKNPDLANTLHIEDILREDEVLKIIDGAPAGFDDIYGEVDGHLRINNFDCSFKGRGLGDYERCLERISNKVPKNTIRKDAKNQVRARISRKRDNIARLISALKLDEDLCSYAEQLEANLRGYI